MPERPLLRLPEPNTARRGNAPGGAGLQTPGLSPDRQRSRAEVGSRFERLRSFLRTPSTVALQPTDDDIAPERAIVFEIARDIDGFLRAAQRIGMEYLTEEESEAPSDDDFGEGGRLYMVMPSLRSMEQLLRLWEVWCSDGEFERGLTPWRDVFQYLREVRPWGPQDRLPSQTRAYVQERLQQEPDENVILEVEFFYRASAEDRERGFANFITSIGDLGGAIISRAVIEDIRYDGALVGITVAGARHLLDEPDQDLAGINEVMYLCPQAMASVVTFDSGGGEGESEPPSELLPPIAALFDGLPIQGHDLLQARLELDDPDGLEDQGVVSVRSHGTQMASLILHGDLNRGEPPIPRRLYVRPVMLVVRTAHGDEEQFPSDRLLIDLIHQAVIRLCEGPNQRPNIFIINMSLGDRNRPYAGRISAWAKLLDFLAHKYRLLFFVSAGNIMEPIPLNTFTTVTSFEQATCEERLRAIVEAWRAKRATRSLLSPGEALNPLTVGAWHNDGSLHEFQAPLAIDPFPSNDLPNLSSGLGPGHRRCIKPDLYIDGGREPVRYMSDADTLKLTPSENLRNLGVSAAAPDPAGRSNRFRSSLTGTSAATALATRAAIQIFDLATSRESEGPLHDMPPEYRAVVVKALMMHGTRWNANQLLFDQVPPRTDRHEHHKQILAQLLGYGRAEVSRSLECLSERATLVGFGDIEKDGAAVYELPLPPALSGSLAYRAVTFTVAWLSPINVRHRAYRTAHLSVRRVDDDLGLAVSRSRFQPSHNAVQRGTVFHERYEGEEAAGFVDGATFRFQVECRSQAGALSDPVPYGIAVSLEVGVDTGIDVYSEIRTRLQVRPRA